MSIAAHQRIGELHRSMSAVQHDLLVEVARVDAEEEWKADGATDMVSWLVHALGVARTTARRWVEVARRLEPQPGVAEELRKGALSFDQVRPLGVLIEDAVAEADEIGAEGIAVSAPEQIVADMVAMARHTEAAELEQMCRRRRVTLAKERTDHDASEVQSWWDTDRRFFHMKGKIAGYDGALVELAMNRLSLQAPRDPHSGHFRPYDERAAEALVQMASQVLAGDGDADRATVLVHVDAASLADADGTGGYVPDGPTISTETARRISCDSRTQNVVDGADGSPIGVGRTTRTIPPWLARMVKERDETCRFPGCPRSRWVHIHHMVHWARGGPTNLDNLVLLCNSHHRMLHREDWEIIGNPHDQLIWTKPMPVTGAMLQISESEMTTEPLPEPIRTVDLAERIRDNDTRFVAEWGPLPGPSP